MREFRVAQIALVALVGAALLLVAPRTVAAQTDDDYRVYGGSYEVGNYEIGNYEAGNYEVSADAGLPIGADAVRNRAQVGRATIDRAFPNVVLAGVDTDQAVFEDLEVAEGETVEGNVVVYNGDARIRNDGRISGDLVVYSGDIRIDADGSVDGNASTFSGDIRLSGSVGGNLTAWSGDITLRDGSSVGGDVSVLNGEVKRGSDARVGGNIVRGPRLEIPSVPAPSLGFSGGAAGADSVAGAAPGVVRRFVSFVFRLLGMALLALLAGLVTWLIAQIRPSLVRNTQATLNAKPALSFVVGILANVVLLLAGGAFAVTVCLIPLTFVSYAILLGLNLVGWAALASEVGRRLTTRYEVEMRWDVAMAAAATLMFAGLGFFWAIGSCFRFFGFAGMLVVSSIGAGAVLLPLVERIMHPQQAQLPETSSALRNVQAGDGEASAAEIAVEAEHGDVGGEEIATAADADDFTQLYGIGPVTAARLAEAGITTFAQMAALTSEQLGGILQWSSTRVEESGILKQAKELAEASED